MKEILQIEGLGTKGDGLAQSREETLFVPFALPGETVRVERRGKSARLMEVLEASPLRVAPACRHFGQCGGCMLQHLEEEAYCRWKEEKVALALRQQGISVPVAQMLRCKPGTRRRASFTAQRLGSSCMIGFSEAGSHRLVSLQECPVLLPQIVQRLPQLRELAAAAGERALRLAVTWTDSGLDVELTGLLRLTESRRQALVRIALTHEFARLTVEGEIIVEPRKPFVMAGEAALSPPPGGFLQATAEAEAAMADEVVTHLRNCRRVADLFAGSGAFALRLARTAAVHAVDSEQPALDALERAFRGTPGLKTITTARRDLFRRPLQAAELNVFDGVVFDPPRAGAAELAAEIARSSVRKVAAISCNPATLSRDLAQLLAGGYRIRSVTPIDQFLWSAHVEVVALLER